MWFLQSNASFCHGDDRLGAYADLLGAMEFPDYWLVSCSDAFTFFVINFEWPIGNSRPIEQLVRCGSELCIESSGGFLPFDMDSLEYELRATSWGLAEVKESWTPARTSSAQVPPHIKDAW